MSDERNSSKAHEPSVPTVLKPMDEGELVITNKRAQGGACHMALLTRACLWTM